MQACRKRGWGAGGAADPQILADQKAPPGSSGAPHYYMPPQIFRPCNMPVDGTVWLHLFLCSHEYILTGK